MSGCSLILTIVMVTILFNHSMTQPLKEEEHFKQVIHPMEDHNSAGEPIFNDPKKKAKEPEVTIRGEPIGTDGTAFNEEFIAWWAEYHPIRDVMRKFRLRKSTIEKIIKKFTKAHKAVANEVDPCTSFKVKLETFKEYNIPISWRRCAQICAITKECHSWSFTKTTKQGPRTSDDNGKCLLERLRLHYSGVKGCSSRDVQVAFCPRSYPKAFNYGRTCCKGEGAGAYRTGNINYDSLKFWDTSGCSFTISCKAATGRSVCVNNADIRQGISIWAERSSTLPTITTVGHK